MTGSSTPRAAPLHQQVRAQAGLELRLLVRNGESLLIAFGIPLGVLVFASQVVSVSFGPGDPLDTLVPAVLALSVMSTAFTAQAIQTGFERKYAVLKRLGASPLGRPTFVASKALAVTALVAVQTVLVLGVGLLLGWRWPDGALVGLLLAGLVLGTAAFTSLGLLLAGSLKAELTLGLANAIYLVLAAVGALALRVDASGLAAVVVRATPSGALAVVLGRSLPAVEVPPGVGVAALALAAWLVVGALAAVRTFRWEP